MRIKHYIFVLFILTIFLIFTGCMPNHVYVQPEFDKKPLPNKIILVTPDISIYEFGYKGKTALKKDWTQFANTASQEYCTKKIPKLNIIPIDETKLINIDDEYKDIKALFEAGNKSILNQYFLRGKNDDFMKEKLNYRLGSLEKIFDKTGADSVLFIYGIDYIASTERKAATAAGMAAGIALGVLTGFAIVPINAGGFAYMGAALVDKNGEIQWSNYIMSKDKSLNDKDDIDGLMCQLFVSYTNCPVTYHELRK
jgi:hypothetical protein